MRRYLLHLGGLLCAFILVALSDFIGRSPGLVAMLVSTFLLSFGTVAAVIIILVHVLIGERRGSESDKISVPPSDVAEAADATPDVQH